MILSFYKELTFEVGEKICHLSRILKINHIGQAEMEKPINIVLSGRVKISLMLL